MKLVNKNFFITYDCDMEMLLDCDPLTVDTH